MVLQKSLCRSCLSCAVFCLASAAACAAPFTSLRGYTLNVPAGWHVQLHPAPNGDANIVVNTPVAAGNRMTTPIFQIQYRPVDPRITSADLETINRGALFTVRKSFPDLKVLSQVSSTLDGVRDIDCIFTATANGLPLRFHEVLVAKNKGVFTFTSICPAQVLPHYASTYAQMMASVRWKS